MKSVGTLDTKTLRRFVKQLESDGCIKSHDSKARTMIVRDGGTTVLRAIQHPAGYWITRYFNSERVTWSW